MDEKIIQTPQGESIAPDFPGTMRTAKCRELLAKEALRRITLEKEIDRRFGSGTANQLIEETTPGRIEHYRHNVEQIYNLTAEETALELLAKVWKVIGRLLVGRSPAELHWLGLDGIDELRRNIANTLLFSGIVQGDEMIAEYHNCQPGRLVPSVVRLESGRKACEITENGAISVSCDLTPEEYRQVITALLREREQIASRNDMILRFKEDQYNAGYR